MSHGFVRINTDQRQKCIGPSRKKRAQDDKTVVMR